MNSMEKIVQKIPFFRGLSPSHVRGILQVGQITTHTQGQILCKEGEKSRSLFILMAGELAVKTEDRELARIKSVEIVGEMGVITGQPRCATIQAAKDATLMVIRKIDLDRLLKNDLELASKVYKNILDSLCQKLRDNNINIINLQIQMGTAPAV